MYGLKIVVVALLAFAASSCASPEPEPTFGLLRHHRHGWAPFKFYRHFPGYRGLGHVYPVGGGGLLTGLGFLARGLVDVVGNAGDILVDLAHGKIPGTFDDAMNAVISVGRAAGNIINAFIPGLGSLLGNMVVAIAKIVICVLGSPGLTGAVLHDRRGGYGNTRDIPYICHADYGHRWGWGGYRGGYGSVSHVIRFYKLHDAHKRVKLLINRHTRGRGLRGLPRAPRWVATRVLELARLFRRHPRAWRHKDAYICFFKVTAIIGAVANSYRPGLGPNIVEGLLNFVAPSFKKHGLPDVFPQGKIILHKIGRLPRYDWNGAIQWEKDELNDWDKEWDKDDDASDDDGFFDDGVNVPEKDSNDSDDDDDDNNNNNKNNNSNNNNSNKNNNSNNNSNTSNNSENNTSNNVSNTENNTKNTVNNNENNTKNTVNNTENNTKNNVENTENNTKNNVENTENNTKNNVENNTTNTVNNVENDTTNNSNNNGGGKKGSKKSKSSQSSEESSEESDESDEESSASSSANESSNSSNNASSGESSASEESEQSTVSADGQGGVSSSSSSKSNNAKSDSSSSNNSSSSSNNSNTSSKKSHKSNKKSSKSNKSSEDEEEQYE